MDTISPVIINYLENRLTLDQATRDFMISTMGVEPHEHHEFLANLDWDDDHTGISMLVISPSPEIRSELEPLIPHQGLSRIQVDQLVKDITKFITRIKLITDNNRSISLKPPCSLVERYIRMLNLERKVFASPACLDAHNHLLARNIFRMTLHPLTEDQSRFIEQVLGLYEEKSTLIPDPGKAFLLVREIFDRGDRDTPAQKLIQQEAERLARDLSSAQEFSRHMKRYSPEFIMMNRIPTPVEPPHLMEEKLTILNSISIHLWGTRLVGSEPDEHHETARTGEDMVDFLTGREP